MLVRSLWSRGPWKSVFLTTGLSPPKPTANGGEYFPPPKTGPRGGNIAERTTACVTDAECNRSITSYYRVSYEPDLLISDPIAGLRRHRDTFTTIPLSRDPGIPVACASQLHLD